MKSRMTQRLRTSVDEILRDSPLDLGGNLDLQRGNVPNEGTSDQLRRAADATIAAWPAA